MNIIPENHSELTANEESDLGFILENPIIEVIKSPEDVSCVVSLAEILKTYYKRHGATLYPIFFDIVTHNTPSNQLQLLTAIFTYRQAFKSLLGFDEFLRIKFHDFELEKIQSKPLPDAAVKPSLVDEFAKHGDESELETDLEDLNLIKNELSSLFGEGKEQHYLLKITPNTLDLLEKHRQEGESYNKALVRMMTILSAL